MASSPRSPNDGEDNEEDSGNSSFDTWLYAPRGRENCDAAGTVR